MKKFFSLIAAVLFAGSMIAADQLKATLDFTGTAWNIPTSGTNTEAAQFTDGTYTITLAATTNYKQNDGYLILGKANSTLTLPAFEWKTTKIVVTGRSGASAAVKQNIYVGENAVSTETTGATEANAYAIAADYQAAGNVYVLKVNSAHNTQITKIEVYTDDGQAPTPVDTYTVAGAPASVFGEEWNPALEANDMKVANGLYKWEKTELQLTAGKIEFKVVKNHSWDNPAYPAQNYELNIAEEGEYILTITFDLATETVAAEALKKEPLADPTNCAEAAAAALSVSKNNEPYNGGKEYTIEGFVTEIATAYSEQYHNITFWMADTEDGGQVLEAYRAVCETEADAPAVGDKVAVTGKLTKYNTTPEFAAGCTFVIIKDEPAEDEVVYNWAENIGTTILGKAGVELGTVKIHTNTDEVPCIKFTSSFVYEEGKFIAIKPAEGGFKAGDSIKLAVCFNNSDDTKQAAIQIHAANGVDSLYRTAPGINGRTSADDPVVETYVLASDQDSLLLGRKGNTGACLTLLAVVRPASVEPIVPTVKYFVAGSMNEWSANEAYELAPNKEKAGEFFGEFTFAANDEFKVIAVEENVITTWFPGGMGNNYKITEDGDYRIDFNPAGNVEGWYEGFFQVLKKEEPIVGSYEVAEAIAAGLADDTEIEVRGVITKMEFKGKNFAKYGSVNIYVADATGAEGEFEFYNCYSLEADTFRASTPEFDPESTAWAQFTEVVDGNGVAIHVGDTVVAFGKYKLYNSTHELNTGCFLVDIKHAEAAEPVEHVVLGVNVPAVEGGVQAFGFAEEAVTMTLIDETGWYLSSDIYAKASDVFMLRDAANAESLLCKFYPADNEEGGVWVRLAITFGEVWADDTYKGDPVKFIELDMSDASLYAWKTDYDTIVPSTEIALAFDNGMVDNTYFEEYGTSDIILFNIPVVEGKLVGDGDYLVLDLYPEDPNNITGAYSIAEENLDDYYTYLIRINGTDTAEVAFAAGEVAVEVLAVSIEQSAAQIAVVAALTSTTGDIYTVNAELVVYYDFIEQDVENVAIDPKAIKKVEMGQVIIEKNGVKYNVLGQQVR